MSESAGALPRLAARATAKRSIDVAALLGIVGLGALGLLLRLHDIGRESMWLDEAGRIAIAQLPPSQIASGVAALELSPPLYHYLLAAWMRLFGSGDVAVRAFSATLVLPSIALAWLLGRAVGGRTVAALLALLVAVNPFAVHFGQEAAMYALLLPLGTATLVAAIGVLEGSRVSRARWLGAYVVAGTLALFTHYYAALLLGAIGLVAVVHAARLRAWHGVAAWIGAHLVIVLAFLPWFGVALSQVQLAASVEDWAGIAPPDAVSQWAAALLANGAPAARSGAAVGLAVAGAALGAWRLRERAMLAALLLAGLVLPLVAAVLLAGPAHAFRPRGFIVVVPALWALLAVALAPHLGARRRAPPRVEPPPSNAVGSRQEAAARPWRDWQLLARLVLGAGLVLLTATGLVSYAHERKEDWRGAAGLLAARAGPTDPIFFVHFAGQVALDRYFNGPQPRIGLPQSFHWRDGYRAPYRVTAADVERELPAALAGRRRAWLVLSHDAGRGSDLVTGYLERWSGSPEDSAEVPLVGVRVIGYTRAEQPSDEGPAHD